MVSGAPVTAPSLCGENALGNADCEYVMFGEWDVSLLDYTCCAHGFSDPAPAAVIDFVEPYQVRAWAY